MPFHSERLCLFQWNCLANHSKPSPCHKALKGWLSTPGEEEPETFLRIDDYKD